MAGQLHDGGRHSFFVHGMTRRALMNTTTIIIILVVLLLLGGGWGFSRRGRM